MFEKHIGVFENQIFCKNRRNRYFRTLQYTFNVFNFDFFETSVKFNTLISITI